MLNLIRMLLVHSSSNADVSLKSSLYSVAIHTFLSIIGHGLDRMTG
jgi:hypothetical protein